MSAKISESTSFIPYGRQSVDKDDIDAVVRVLRSDWLTTGPKVAEFEKAVAGFCGARHAVAVSSGTAALHAAMHAVGVGPGDEVIVPAMTFAATANCVVYQGGRPVFVDVDPETLLINAENIKAKITPATKAIIAVDYAGQPCDYGALREIAQKNKLFLVADACHSLGGKYKGEQVGSLADLTVFSFHPVKHITTGEGGMVVTDSSKFAEKISRFRNHGIATDHRQRELAGTWHYEMSELGYNYRLSDIHCALGESQLAKLPQWLEIRRTLAGRYNKLFTGLKNVSPLKVSRDVSHAYHLYVVKLADHVDRRQIFQKLRDRGIGVNVHYLPVHLHPFYQEKFGYGLGLCPAAEAAYEKILSLPLHQGMSFGDVDRVVKELSELLG